MSQEVQASLLEFALDQVSPQLRFYYRHRDDPTFKAQRQIDKSSWYARNKIRAQAYRKKHYRAHLKKYKEGSKIRGKKLYEKNRALCLDHYGRVCSCCGVEEEAFLTIDHMNGKKDRHESGDKLYRMLVKNGFPEGFQTLCYNCNIAKGHRGVCPHRAQSRG